MSRFIEVLDAYASRAEPNSLTQLAEEVRQRLSSDRSRISSEFPYFLRREAPVSGDVRDGPLRGPRRRIR